jgi:hypothetical protein
MGAKADHKMLIKLTEDENIDAEDSKSVYKNGSNKQPQASPNHGKVRRLTDNLVLLGKSGITITILTNSRL